MTQNESMINEIRTAIGAHGIWKLRLKTALTTGKVDFNAADLACDDKCDFGRWLHGPNIPPQVRSGGHYDVVRQKHADFHKALAQTVDAAMKGNTALSATLLDGAFEEKSRALAGEMQNWMKELRV
jgi:hypothetical protein